MHTTPKAHPRPAPRLLHWRRALHLLDIENLTGGPHGATYAQTADLYRKAVRPGPQDLVIVGCDKSGTFDAANALPHARLAIGTGPDGADNALVAALDERVLNERFDALVVGSGDHRFTFCAARAKAAGLTTVAVVGKGRLSRALAHAVDLVIYLPDFDDTAALTTPVAS